MAETKTKAKAQTQAPQQAPTGNLPAVREQVDGFMEQFHARGPRGYAPLLPPHLPFEKFEASVRAAIVKDPELVTKCNHATMFRACSEAAELGLSLSPTLKEADILKVWNKRLNNGRGGLEAQFRPRYNGLMKLARNSGEVTDIEAHPVLKWDTFDYAYGLKPFLDHRPGNPPIGYEREEYWGLIYAYCTWEIAGRIKFDVMPLADVIRIMARTSSRNKEGAIVGPWITDFTEMARKTTVRRASKFMPLSAENMRKFAVAVDLDNRREGGEEVTLDHDTGEVVDITGSDVDDDGVIDQPPQQQTEQRKTQMDDLESRMAGGATRREPPAEERRQEQQKQQPKQQPAAAPAKVEKLEPPILNGMRDLEAWIPLAEEAVKPLNAEQRAEWKAMHSKILDAIEYSPHVDALETLSKMLP
jgi:recombination protein RecT